MQCLEKIGLDLNLSVTLTVDFFEYFVEESFELFLSMILLVFLDLTGQVVAFVTSDFSNQRVKCVVHKMSQCRRGFEERAVPQHGKLLAFLNTYLKKKVFLFMGWYK